VDPARDARASQTKRVGKCFYEPERGVGDFVDYPIHSADPREIFQRDTSALNERATAAAVAIILIYSSPPRYKAPPCGLRLDAPVRDVTRKWCNFQLHTNKSQRVYYVRV